MSTTASNRVPPLFLFALVAVHVVAAAALLRDPGVKTPDYAATSDAARYHEIATSPGRPYRDFEVEYPPLAYLGLDAIDTGDFDSTLNVLIVTQLLADLGIVGLLLWNWGSRAAASYLIIAAPILATVLTKFDLVSVLLALLAVSLVSRSRDGPGGVALAASVFVKLWPVVLTPWLLVKRRWRAMAWTLAGGFVGLVLWVWLGDIDGPRQVLTFRGAEGWHVESIPAQLALLGGAGDMRFEAGSWRVGAPPSWVGVLLAVAALAFAWWVWNQSREREDIGLPATVSVAALLVLSTVLSEQFIVWLVPWAAIAGAAGYRRIERLTLVAVVVTVVLQVFIDEPSSDTTVAQIGYGLRNLVLVAIVIVGTLRLRSTSVNAGAP